MGCGRDDRGGDRQRLTGPERVEKMCRQVPVNSTDRWVPLEDWSTVGSAAKPARRDLLPTTAGQEFDEPLVLCGPLSPIASECRPIAG